MTAIGTVQGNRIELEEPVTLPPGTKVQVYLVPLVGMPASSLIGRFADEAELLDEIVANALQARETRPLRGTDGESSA